MPTRLFTIVGFALITFGTISHVSAEILCEVFSGIARETKRRNCWPEPFLGPDRATVRAPFAAQVNNGWRKQNMLGEFHFEQGSGNLTEAGRLKIRWILETCPQQHRWIYVHTASSAEETAARLAAVRQFAAQITPTELPPILETSIPDQGWPAEDVEAIAKKYRSSYPTPRLPQQTSTSIGGGGGLSASGGNQ